MVLRSMAEPALRQEMYGQQQLSSHAWCYCGRRGTRSSSYMFTDFAIALAISQYSPRSFAHSAIKSQAYCCFFFGPATVGVFGLGVLGAGRMAAKGSFAF